MFPINTRSNNLLNDCDPFKPEIRSNARAMASLLARVYDLGGGGSFELSFDVDEAGNVVNLALYEMEEPEEEENEEVFEDDDDEIYAD